MAKHIITVADISDLHCGGATALMPPVWRNADGLEIRQSREQVWIWDCWQDMAQQIKTEALGGAEVFGLFNGDIVEGRHHETPQLVSVEPEDHADIAVECIDMVAAWCKKMMFICGTEAHVGRQGRTENITARVFAEQGKTVIKPNLGPLYVWPAALVDIGGLRFNVAHHIGGSGVERNQNNAASAEAVDQVHEALYNDLQVPNYILRGHTHRFAKGYAMETDTVALTSGCWQLSTSHGHRIKAHKPPHIGCWLIRIFDDGTTSDKKIRYPIPEHLRHIVRVDFNANTKTNKAKQSASGSNQRRTSPRRDGQRSTRTAGQHQSGRGGRGGASNHGAGIRGVAQPKPQTKRNIRSGA